jgi:hypothetical protein
VQNESVDRTLWEDYKNRHQTASEPQVSYPTWAVDLKAAFGQWLAHMETLKDIADNGGLYGGIPPLAAISRVKTDVMWLASETLYVMTATENLQKWLSEPPKK